MSKKIFMLALLLLFAFTERAMAGVGYRITSTRRNGTQATYKVRFGGGWSFGLYTAFCLRQDEFVYLSWKVGEPRPTPVAIIWDHRTGEAIQLYKFPDCLDPLPVIPSLQDLNVFAFTGDKNFKVTEEILYD